MPHTRRPILFAEAFSLAILATSAAGPVAAASPADAWTGVWTKVGSSNFDPNQPANVADKPPYASAVASNLRPVPAMSRTEMIDTTTCNARPSGGLGMMINPYPIEVASSSRQITLIAEYPMVRRIFLDGRPQPDDFVTNYSGFSSGRWEGDTLLVDTVGLKDDLLLPHGLPVGANSRLSERIRLRDPNTLVDEITLKSDALAKPYVTTRVYRRAPGYRMTQYLCENGRTPELR